MNEVWKDIPGYDGLYQCSNLGRFRAPAKIENSDRRYCVRKEKILKATYEGNGYLQIGLAIEKKQVRFLAHRLIAAAFIPTVEGKDFVNHINGIKDDNRVENLEWVTKSENTIHSFKIGLQDNQGTNHPQAKIDDHAVREIRIKYKSGLYSSRGLASEYSMSKTSILDIIKHKAWSHVD